MNILGVSAYYHDSGAVLVQDGKIVAAAQEERFSRRKHDARFPMHAVKYCLAEGGVGKDEIDVFVFYDKPIAKFERILKSYFAVAPRGLKPFMMAIPMWLKQKLWIPYMIEKNLNKLGYSMAKELMFTEHHESHAASAFFPSPYKSAAILTLDGVGEWASCTLGKGEGNKIELFSEMRFPHSIGLLYSAFTYFTGFRVNSGEYKLMGLAPYGEAVYVDKIKDNLIDLKEDGSFRMNMDYFSFVNGLTMTNDKFAALFGGPARKPESRITKREMDIAKSIQVVTEEIVMKMAVHLHKVTGEKNLVMAGGVALNCVANGKLLADGPFDSIWIQPAAGDAGGALGAAMFVWHQVQGNQREADGVNDKMQGSYLGPKFSNEEIAAFLKAKGYKAHKLEGKAWAEKIAEILDSEKVVGLCQGRMEFGPRALGGRSIIGDPRSPKMQSVMNLKIKYRESFRPFAPSCLAEKISEYFEIEQESPYMLLVAPVRKDRCIEMEDQPVDDYDMLKRVNLPRSDIPAITHVDYSARIQSVTPKSNKPYYDIIKAFEERTGYGIIINTSFNVRGEPIVATPEDAYRCFMRTEMDCLVLESYILYKEEQPEWKEEGDWRKEHKLD